MLGRSRGDAVSVVVLGVEHVPLVVGDPVREVPPAALPAPLPGLGAVVAARVATVQAVNRLSPGPVLALGHGVALV